MSIIIESLEKTLKELILKRDKLHKDLFVNPLSEVCTLRIEFQKLAKEKGIMSEECKDFANKNADKEKELLKLSRWQIENTVTATKDLAKYDCSIVELQNEIFMKKGLRDIKNEKN